MKIIKSPKKRHKAKPVKVNGYLRIGSVYVSRGFIISALIALFTLGVLYMIALHPIIVALWYESQDMPGFSIHSPYLAGYSGKGRLYWPDDLLIYEGDIGGAVISGNGKLYQNGLLLYDGEFKENKYHGRGTLYAPDGAVTYSGDFAENIPHGFGTLYFAQDGELYSYTGAFDSGAQCGEGALRRNNALIYEGGFKNDMRDGFGREYADGKLRYVGLFLRDDYEGEGKLFDANGRLLYEGGFVSGQYGGDGTEYNPDTGYPVFKGKYLDGGRMEAGIEYDAQGIPATETTLDSDPLELMDAKYADVLAVLSRNSATCREQALDGLHLIIDEAGGALYAFSLNEAGGPETIANIYLCGLASAGGFVVGSEMGDTPELQAWIPEIGAWERFALSLSNTIWGKETRADELICASFESEGHSVTAFCEAVEEQAELTDKFTKDIPEDVFAKELPGDVSPMKAGRIVFIRVGRPTPAEEALQTED